MSPESTDTGTSYVRLDLLNAVRTVVRRRYFLAACTLGGLVIGLVLCFVLKPWYSAEASFLPPKPTEAGVTEPVSLLLGSTDQSDSYLGMLASRAVADDVIDRLNLMSVYKTKLRVDARTRLARNSNFTVNKNSLVQVTVTSGDPRLAADIANAYLEALYRLKGAMLESSSDHRRAFFEDQLEKQKQALAAAELDLKTTQQKTGIVLPANEAQAGLSATAQIQAQIGQAETRLAGLLAGATENNPQVVEARSELNQLETQLVRLQSVATPRRPGGGLAPTGQLPELTLENLQKEREVKLRETVYDSVVAQYEKAGIAATDPGPQLEIVDRAVEPERKSGPPRTLLAIGGFAVGFLFGLAWLLFGGALRKFAAAVRQPATTESR